MNYKERVEYMRENLAELKEDIATLNSNIAEMEKILDTIQSDEDLLKHEDFDIEKGLKIIALF